MEEQDMTFPERPMLHAHTLDFVHPLTKNPIHLTANLPPDFLSCLRMLRDIDLPLRTMM